MKLNRLSVYLPLMYQVSAGMLLINVKGIRFFKREHENNMVSIYNNSNENDGNEITEGKVS
jgi:hypothetical protein